MMQVYSIGKYDNCLFSVELYIDRTNQIFLIEHDELGDVYRYENGTFVKDETIFACEVKGIRPATRSELKAAKLWDMVINKDDFSCTEDELEEYLKLAEEER
jgi:hypothetical protein